MLSRLSCFLSLILIFTPAMSGHTIPGTQGKKDEPIKLDTFLVNIQTAVVDSYERNVSGLKAENFEIWDNGVKQEVGHFSDASTPIKLVVVFDATGSMGPKAVHATKALGHLLKSGHKDDRLALVCLKDGRAFMAHDYTFDANAILNALTFVQTKGQTALYDAVVLAVDIAQRGRHEREEREKMAIVVISDGQDNNSRYTYKEMRERIRESGVLVYCIGVIKPDEELNFVGKGVLEEIARMSGGRAFFPPFSYIKDANGAPVSDAGLIPELEDIFWRIAIELREQYSLGYYPTNLKHDGKWHEIRIKIKNAPRGLGRLHPQYRNKYQDYKL